MLRRRIFSSAMASVMALSSIAVVANAEETAVTNAKTKNDLEAYVKSFETFREDEIYQYGSISGENFLNAIEYADNVLADGTASAEDYTVAYDMIEAVYKRLKIRSVDELKNLLANYKDEYDRGNILNEDLNDEEFQNGDGQYDDFATAYADAEGVLDSSDSRLITDAYETLDACFKKLVRLPTVTKAQFRAVLKSYEENVLKREFENDPWRRGTMSGDWVSMNNVDLGDYWMYQNDIMTYGALYNHVTALEDDIYGQYAVIDQIKTLNVTSDPAVVTMYKVAQDAVALMGAWTADDTARATKANVTKLLDQYHNVLVFDYDAAAAEALYQAICDDLGYDVPVKDNNNGIWKIDLTTFNIILDNNAYSETKFDKTTGANILVQNDGAPIYIPVTKEGYWNPDETIIDNAKNKVKGVSYKTINKKKATDIVQFVKLDASKVETAFAPELPEVKATTSVETPAEAVDAIEKLETSYSGTCADNATANAEKVPGELAAFEKFTALSNADQTKITTTIVDFYKKADELFAKVNAIVAEIKALLASIEAETVVVEADSAKETALQLLAELKALQSEIDTMLKPLGEVETTLGWWPMPADYYGTKQYFIGNVDNDNPDNSFAGANDLLAELETALNEISDRDADLAREAQTDTTNSQLNNVIDGGDAIEWIQSWTDQTVESNATYQVDLALAMDLADFYLTTTDKDDIKQFSQISDIDYTEAVGDKAYGSSAEWTLVHRYLKYALEDKYAAAAGVTHTKAEVQELITKAYDLADKTGEAALFENYHNKLATARKDAVEWVKLANKDKLYKDCSSSYTFDLSDGTEVTYDSTGMYNYVWPLYEQLEKEYNAFKYSFAEIAEKIYLYEDMIDAGELEATNALLAAIEETAYCLSVVETLVDANANELEENDAFSGDRFAQFYNRVYTNEGEFDSLKLSTGNVKIAAAKDGANQSHYNLVQAFNAMEAEVKKQTEVTVIKGDVDGNGIVNSLDAAAILTNIVNEIAMDAAVADYDNSGVVNSLDAAAILKAIVNA